MILTKNNSRKSIMYLRFNLLTAVSANKNGIKVELSGIPKSNLGLDKVIFF